MRIYGEARLSPAAQAELPPELGSVLIPRGASSGGIVSNGLLNRVGTYWDVEANTIKPREEWAFDDRNRSMPPRRPALDAVVWLVRNPEAVGIAKVSHLFIDLEGYQDDNDGRESLAAAYYLRAKLPKTYLVTTYSRWAGGGERLRTFTENDDACAYTLYAWNRVAMAADPADEWSRMVGEYEDELEAVSPDKPRVAFVMPLWQIWWATDPQYAGILHLDNTPLSIDFWRQMKDRLQKPPRRNGRSYRPWDLFAFGAYVDALAPHVDVLIPKKATQ